MQRLLPRTRSKVYKPIFVDRYGRRRRAVIGTGIVLGLALVAWLAIMTIGFAGVLSEPPGLVAVDLAA